MIDVNSHQIVLNVDSGASETRIRRNCDHLFDCLAPAFWSCWLRPNVKNTFAAFERQYCENASYFPGMIVAADRSWRMRAGTSRGFHSFLAPLDWETTRAAGDLRSSGISSAVRR
eukprot:COSAG06_NODE_5247_length_3612_cov_1.381725_4_plen_115_part_00